MLKWGALDYASSAFFDCSISHAMVADTSVAIATSPAQYPLIMQQKRENDGCTTAFRKNLGAAAYALAATYDAMACGWLGGEVSEPPP